MARDFFVIKHVSPLVMSWRLFTVAANTSTVIEEGGCVVRGKRDTYSWARMGTGFSEGAHTWRLRVCRHYCELCQPYGSSCARPPTRLFLWAYILRVLKFCR